MPARSPAQQAVAAAKTELENRQKGAAPKVEALYTALSEGKWPQILAAAEAVLVAVPEHPAARQARTRAWQQIAAIGPAAAAQWPQRGARTAQPAVHRPWTRSDRRQAGAGQSPRPQGSCWPTPADSQKRRASSGWPVARAGSGSGPEPSGRGPVDPGRPRPLARAEAAGPKGRFLLWVDAVGGYLVCLDDRIVLGRAGPDSPADVPLMGDLSRNHATLIRNGEGYVLQAHQPRSSTASRSSTRSCSATVT